MSLRIRYYKITSINGGDLDEILKAIRRDEYSTKKTWGFANMTLQGRTLRGQYIERTEAVTKVVDPFGKVLEFPHVDYDHFVFQIGTSFPQLELHDPGRSLGAFFNQIAQYLSFRIALDAPVLDVLRWVDAMGAQADSLQVHGAVVTDVSLSNSVSAKVGLAGTDDVRPFIRKLVGKRRYSMQKVQLTGLLRSLPFKCELFADARATILNGVEPEVASLLRDTVAQIAS